MTYQTKEVLFNEIEGVLNGQGFQVVQQDQTRPWGGFFVIEESQAQHFANTYFNGLDVQELKISGTLSPKILVVAPGKRLSWQYQHRRAEIWQLLRGVVGVVPRRTDEDT